MDFQNRERQSPFSPSAARDTASDPPAMYWSPSPDLMAWNAMRIVCRLDEQ